jgi:predicted ATPase/transcriptional regulator with XRE-family HTH domain/Tfp pilus assembly protein PilF
MDQSETFGSWLKRRRRALDLTQGALADCAGCSVVTIRKFEADERRPSRQLAELLAECLQIPAAETETFISFARQPETVEAVPPPVIGTPIPALPPAPERPAASLPSASSDARRRPPAPPVVLPAPLSGLVGREADVTAVETLLLRPGVRLVTLTGPGGTGKTRLAIETARHLAKTQPQEFPDGLFFIDLAPITDPALFAGTLMISLGIGDTGGRSPYEAVRDFLQPRQALLVLDNFEQLLDAGDDLVALLTAAGGLTALVTSRTVLHLYGEYEYPVAPLGLPPTLTGIDPKSLPAYPAIELFVERSRAANPRFALTQDNALAVARICAKLDGLPLAIELAAARSKMLSPSVLLSQLTSSLDLAATHRHVSERQRTMRGAIEWSYRLLSPEEQRLFDRLGVLAGSFNAATAAPIVAEQTGDVDDPDAITPDLAIVDGLSALLDKSMIKQVPDSNDDDPRFHLLGVMREYAREQLATQGILDEVQQRHARHFLALARQAMPRLEGPQQSAWLAKLVLAQDDLRHAMAWSLATPDKTSMALEIAVSLGSYWLIRGQFAEGRRWLKTALDANTGAPIDLRARGNGAAGILARYHDDLAEAGQYIQTSLGLWELMGGKADQYQIANLLRSQAAVAYVREEFSDAIRYCEQALAIFRELDQRPAVAGTIYNLALIHQHAGDYEAARRYYTEALPLLRVAGTPLVLLNGLNGFGTLEHMSGNQPVARDYLEEALSISERMGDVHSQAMVLSNLGEVALVQDRLDEARVCVERSIVLSREGDFKLHLAYALLVRGLIGLYERAPAAVVWPDLVEPGHTWRELEMNRMLYRFLGAGACLLARAGRLETAIRLLAHTEAERLKAGSLRVRAPVFEPLYREVEEVGRSGLSEAAFTAADEAGRRLSLAEALELAHLEGQQIIADVPLPATGLPEEQGGPAVVPAGDHLLAVGGMGEVYLARDDSGRTVVVKRLRREFTAGNPEFLQRFIREGELLRQLHHPNIVEMLDARRATDGRYAITMEYVPGGTLRDRLDKEGRMAARQAIEIALELADALARAHHLGIIHRDLKPENVLLAADGTPRLTDFGLAIDTRENIRLTQVGAVLGTVAYLSPEACRGEQPDPAGDIWALGVTLVEMLTGRHPYLQDNVAATLMAITGQPAETTGIPPRLAGLIDRMLARDPAQRIDNARQVAAELESILADLA